MTTMDAFTASQRMMVKGIEKQGVVGTVNGKQTEKGKDSEGETKSAGGSGVTGARFESNYVLDLLQAGLYF